MAGKRIKALVEKVSYSPDDFLALDNNTLLEAQKIKLRLLGNTYFQGSTDGSDWHDTITGSDTYFRFSTDGGVTWKPLTTNANWIVRKEGVVQKVIANSEFLNLIQGSGIVITTTNQSGGLDVTFTLDRTGDWTGTFDGQEGNYYLDYNNLINKPTIAGGLTLDASAIAGGLTLDEGNQILYFRPATTSQTGYLTSTDWNIFNNKQDFIVAGTTAQYWRGDKTWQTLNTTAVIEGTNLYFTNARARAAISLTTIGNSGPSTYSNITGVLNVPEYTLLGLGGEPIINKSVGYLTWSGSAWVWKNETYDNYANWIARTITSANVQIGTETILSGNTVNLKEGTNITLAQSGSTITINASGTGDDLYSNWTLKANTDGGLAVPSAGIVDLVAGTNMTIVRDGSTNKLTFNSSFTNTTYTAGTGLTLTGTEFSLTNIVAGSTTIGALAYSGTTKVNGTFYGGTVNPTGTTRLNYDGYFYATRFYGDGSNITNINYNNISNPPYIPVTKVINSTHSTAQTPAPAELIDGGPGTINLHRVAKTGAYSDLIGLPSISAVGTLSTISSVGLTPVPEESFSGQIYLHKISKTGVYSDLINKPAPLTLTTEGTGGAASYDSNTGVLNIPISQSSTGGSNWTVSGANIFRNSNVAIGGTSGLAAYTFSIDRTAFGASGTMAYFRGSSTVNYGLKINTGSSTGTGSILLQMGPAGVSTYFDFYGNGQARFIQYGGTAMNGTVTKLLGTDANGFIWSTPIPGGGGGSSPLTTKGDLYTYSTLDDRLAVGANGYILSADSTTATGLKWIPAPTGIWTDGGTFAYLTNFEDIYTPSGKAISWRSTTANVTGSNLFNISATTGYLDFKAGIDNVIAMRLFNNNQPYLSNLGIRGNLSINYGVGSGYETDAYALAIFQANGYDKFGITGTGAMAQTARLASPTTPALNTGLWYAKLDGKVYYKNWLGVEYDLTASGSGTGTVTSVGLNLPVDEFEITVSPITTSGTLTAIWQDQTANYVFAGPESGIIDGRPSFRLLVPADIPALDTSKITTGVFNPARLGTGTTNNTTYLNGDSEWVVLEPGFQDPMEESGDIIYRNSSNVTTKLGRGAAGEVLTSDGTNISWEPVSPGSSSVTANNGLTLASSNIKLGGTLVEDTTINNQSYQLTITGSRSVANPLLYINQTGNGEGLSIKSLSGPAGVFGNNSSSYATLALQNDGGRALDIQTQHSTNNNILEAVRLIRIASSPTTGFGSSVNFYLSTGASNPPSTKLVSRWASYNGSSSASEFIIENKSSSNTIGQTTVSATFKGNGQLQLNQYFGTNFSGTPSKYLAVDSAGNVIRVGDGAGGGISIGDWVEDIAFDFNDVTGSSQTYVIDLDASFAYTITGVVMQSVGASVTFNFVKDGSTNVLSGTPSANVTKSSSYTVSSGAVTTGTILTLVLSSSSATAIRGKVRFMRT